MFSSASRRRVHPFEQGEVNNYSLDGVPIHPVTTKIHASFLTHLPERKETTQGFHHEAKGDFKKFKQSSMDVIGEKLGWISIVVTSQY
jgi:hypothetical protein